MFEDDAILPDDFQPDTPTEETPIDEEQEVATETEESTVEDTKPTEETTEQVETVQDTPKLKLKYNHEDREVSLEEATALAQKGLNYEKAIERAAQEARDAVIAEEGYTWNGIPITTEAEYKQAKMEQDLITKYQDRDLPDEVINELVESRRDREQRAKEKQINDAKARENADLSHFLQYFKETNERDFDPNKDKIPQEVWDANQQGLPLKYAYMEHHTKQLATKVKVIKQNESNKQKAPNGSVTAHGSNEVASEDDFLRGFNSV